MDIGEIIAIVIGLIALIRVAVGIDLVAYLKYRDERRDKRNAETQAEQLRKQTEERQNECTHHWESDASVGTYDALYGCIDDGCGWASSIQVAYHCPFCNATYAGLLLSHTAYPNPKNLTLDGVPIPARGVRQPEGTEEHWLHCNCRTCAYPIVGGYDDVDDLPF